MVKDMLKKSAKLAVALPTASSSMGCFQMQQRHIVDELGSLRPFRGKSSMSGRLEKPISAQERAAAVLVVSPLPADRLRLREIFSQGSWKVHEASDCCEALAVLRDQRVPVLLCERSHANGAWEDLLEGTASLPAPPSLIVFSRLADESLWAKVLNLGGFDLLMTPFEPEEVLRVSFAAWSRWECDFVASTVKRADATDGVVLSAGNVVEPHGYTANGRGDRLSGLPGPARSRWSALRSKREVAEQ